VYWRTVPPPKSRLSTPSVMDQWANRLRLRPVPRKIRVSSWLHWLVALVQSPASQSAVTREKSPPSASSIVSTYRPFSPVCQMPAGVGLTTRVMATTPEVMVKSCPEALKTWNEKVPAKASALAVLTVIDPLPPGKLVLYSPTGLA
jgi:hypothetical protein